MMERSPPQNETAAPQNNDVVTALSAHLVGRHLTEVKRRECDWTFAFEDFTTSGLRVERPWRIIVDGRIAFASSDDGHQFGLPAPLDGEEVARLLLRQKVVERISVRFDTGDLTVVFSSSTFLEVLNMSSGYEGWEIGVPGMMVIATGGGQLAIFSESGQT